MYCSNLCGQYKKNHLWYDIYNLSNILTSLFKRSQFCFKLYSFIVVEMDVFTYEEARLLIGLKFCALNALCFENRKEIFCHSIVIRVSPT